MGDSTRSADLTLAPSPIELVGIWELGLGTAQLSFVSAAGSYNTELNGRNCMFALFLIPPLSLCGSLPSHSHPPPPSFSDVAVILICAIAHDAENETLFPEYTRARSLERGLTTGGGERSRWMGETCAVLSWLMLW